LVVALDFVVASANYVRSPGEHPEISLSLSEDVCMAVDFSIGLVADIGS
jgi:hypothetical protein